MTKDATTPEGRENGITGIISTVANEIALLKDSLAIEAEESVSGMQFYRGRLGGREAVLVQCGRGKVNAGICAQTLILRFGVSSILNTGVAGALNHEINIGSIIISTDTVQHDVDATALGYKPGKLPGTGPDVFPADAELRRLAAASAAAAVPEKRVYEGRICSGDQFISDSARKRQLGEEFGALCCDMEGAAIAQVCAMNAVPFVAIRAISDKADDAGHFSYRSLFEAVARHNAAIVRHMIDNG